MSPTDPVAAPDPLRTETFVAELRRKILHLSFIVLPLEVLHEWLSWPHGRSEWRLLLLALVVGAILLDIVRIHERRVGRFFREFFGQMLRAHEHRALLGSTYLLLAALLAIEIFPQTVAAAAIGFTVVGDGFAAIVGRAFGRHRVFGKSWEGSFGCLAASLAWAAFLAGAGHLPWGVALAGALVASLVEFLPIPLVDNLGITLFAGYAMKLIWSPA